jgi:general secretion pathway protein C
MHRVWTTFETVLRRYPWVIILVALIPCAYFAAVGVTQLVAAAVLKADVATLTRRPATSSTAALAELTSRGRGESSGSAELTAYHVRDTHRILERNVFDADAGCLNCAPPPAETAAETGAPADNAHRSLEPCDGQARVTGAVEVDDPLWSFVFIAPGSGQPAMPHRMTETFDGRTIASIGWHREYGAYVILRQGSDGPRCFYAQIMPPRTAPPPAAAPPTPAGVGGEGTSGALQAAIDRGIQRAGPNEFNVQRSLVDQILENQAELMRQTRIMPHSEGGRTTGVVMFGIRPNALLGRLGMQNGDVLNRINGLEIASPDRALEAYSRLRTSDHITISVTRNGQPVNLDFNIR